MYVYPTRDPASGPAETLETVTFPHPWHALHRLLLDLGHVVPIRSFDESSLSIRAPDVLTRIEKGDPSWETWVPPVVAETIRKKRLFGSPH
jgi:hypothetical protein